MKIPNKTRQVSTGWTQPTQTLSSLIQEFIGNLRIYRNTYQTLYVKDNKKIWLWAEEDTVEHLAQLFNQRFVNLKLSTIKQEIRNFNPLQLSAYDTISPSPTFDFNLNDQTIINVGRNQFISIDPQKITATYNPDSIFSRSTETLGIKYKIVDHILWWVNTYLNNIREPDEKLNETRQDRQREIKENYKDLQYSFYELFDLFNIEYNDRKLLVTWLISNFIGKNYVALELTGSRYSGKTTFQKILKNIIDHSIHPVIQNPKTSKSLAEISFNTHLLSFDQVDSIPIKLQNEMQLLLMGNAVDLSHVYKKQHTVFDLKRPIVWNAIEPIELTTKLNESTISITLPDNQFDKTGKQNFDLTEDHYIALYQSIFQLTKGILKYLNNEQTLHNISHPLGMRDFYNIGEALYRNESQEPEELSNFEIDFSQALKAKSELIIRQTASGDALLNFIESATEQSYTYKLIEWHDLLLEHKSELTGWPKEPKKLGSELDGIARWLQEYDANFFKSDKNGNPNTTGKPQSNYYRTLTIKSPIKPA
ncbi:MAG: hypothetical protein IBX55_12725 [Methyloprofundus sp.]|nr:hypothetical protein [Methyloprofundus sp.]